MLSLTLKKLFRYFIALFLNASPDRIQKLILGVEFFKIRSVFDFDRTLLNVLDTNDAKIIVIGANDGVSFDSLFSILSRKKTRGLIVEPSKKYFPLLKENLKEFKEFHFLNYAIYDYSGEMKLFEVNSCGLQKLPEWGKGIGSVTRTHLEKFDLNANDIDEVYVECKTFRDLLNDFPDFDIIDYLQIDTEGYDARLILSIEFETFKAKLIKFETANLTKIEVLQLKECFDQAGYLFFQGIEDSYAVYRDTKLYFK
jgi:FkbM family methyltransferase